MTILPKLLLFQTKLNTPINIFQKYDSEGYPMEEDGSYEDDSVEDLYDDDGEDDGDESKNDLE